MNMSTRRLEVRFVTPTFLGNADQSGQWRTPPFKALLRQWWRVAWSEAHAHRNDLDTLRQQEGSLFGSAAGSQGQRSKLRIRLSHWERGTMERWERLKNVEHPEVPRPVDAGLYLGYGPITLPRGERYPALKQNAAIQAGECAELQLAFPEQDAPLIDRAVELMNHFGTLGGRSRNGWGSLVLNGLENNSPSLPVRDWQSCLDRDWPHALGSDPQGALAWQTRSVENWQELMGVLANVKIGLRTQFKFNSGRNAREPEPRHWLSHPVTNHNVAPWRQGRLPNSLRFKAIHEPNGKLRGLVFHMPCLPPPQFQPKIRAIEATWEAVYRYLDNDPALNRLAR